MKTPNSEQNSCNTDSPVVDSPIVKPEKTKVEIKYITTHAPTKNISRIPGKRRRRIMRLAGAAGIIIAAYSWMISNKSQHYVDTRNDNQLINIKNQDSLREASGHALDIDSEATATNTTITNTNTKNTNTTVKPIPLDYIYHKIKYGDSLGSIINEYDFPANYPHKIVNAENGAQFKNIRTGKQLQLGINPNTSELKEIRYPLSNLLTLVAHINEDITITTEDVPYETAIISASGSIDHSLFGAALESGIDHNMIMELSEVFGWDIDFGRDIKQGDTFKIVYEQHINNDKVLGNGNILSAEFINNGEKFVAIRYEDSDGNSSYYAPDGSSMKGTFLKSPMKFSRISSRFSKKRFHPILKKWRSHKGVDYAASRGTPIRSVADGKIIFRGTKGGYGRTIVISHGGKYTTLYAHMNKYNKNLHTGKHVKQGQTIGYVGSTGLATGPHLHYEFRVNGVHRNPLTYKTPKAISIKKPELEEFSITANEQLNLLSKIETNSQNAKIASRN